MSDNHAMTPDKFPSAAKILCDLCQLFGERGWCRATSGNFSLRTGESHCLITQSGREKSRLKPDDLMICDFQGQAVDTQRRPSAETPVHTCLYKLDAGIGAVLHTHSVAATVLSRAMGSEFEVTGYEMQKAFAGISSHDDVLTIMNFENDQDMDALARRIGEAWTDGLLGVPGFLIRGHGLYAWGKNAEEARRHVEGFEFLFDCLWQERLARQ
jgi:methylthioribulose-1-phosphate dehydratase